MRFGEEERGINGDNVTTSAFDCKETGDHVHYPPRLRARSPRPHHARPSCIFSSKSRLHFEAAASVHYRECRKNKAVEFGVTAYDGCGEFVASDDDAMKCAACGCHRSFHRRDTADGSIHHHDDGIGNALHLSSAHFRQIYSSPSGCRGREGKKESSSEDRKAGVRSRSARGGVGAATGTGKRYKSKFTVEQKERMMKYAEKLGWKMSNKSSEEVDNFCAEIGVERKTFRVWMNNHKNKSSS